MLTIVTTHPIQYQTPLWRALVADGRIPVEIWFMSDHGVKAGYDREFSRSFAWDVPLLEGYPHRFLKTTGAPVTRYGVRGMRILEPLGSLMEERGTRAVWIQGWQVPGYWQAAWWTKRTGRALWLRGESNDLSGSPGWLRGRLKRRLLERLFRNVDTFLCIGSANKRFYQRYGVEEARLKWAPYCVDNRRIAVRAAELAPQRSRLRQQWNIPNGALCVLFCGKLVARKRPLDLVRAAQLWRRRNGLETRPIHLLFVGSGELEAALRAECNVRYDAEIAAGRPNALPSHGERPSASFAGFLNQSDIVGAYVAADVLALPSETSETWGLVVNEAMACGLPCVVSNACGCAEDLVAPVDRSWVFPTGNAEALGNAISSVVGTVNAHERVLRQIERFEMRHTVEAVVQSYSALTSVQ